MWGLILILFLAGFFTVFTGYIQLGGGRTPAWFVLEGTSARVAGVIMVVVAGLLAYRQSKGESQRRVERARPSRSTGALPSPVQRPLELTEDERRLLELLAEGLSDEQIANRLGMPGLDINMTTLYLCGKFAVKSKPELIQRAREMRLLAPDTKGRISSPEPPTDELQCQEANNNSLERMSASTKARRH